MIINIDREPKYSLYYLGGIILQVLKNNNDITIEKLHEQVEQKIHVDLHIDFVYYSLDWLYILSLIKVEKNRVVLC